MVIIWLMMVNNNLVGGAITILKNDGLRQWGWDDLSLFFEMENNPFIFETTKNQHFSE